MTAFQNAAAERQMKDFLRAACRVLMVTTPDVVDGISTSLRLNEWTGNPELWRSEAEALAREYGTEVEFAAHADRLHVRFSRPGAEEKRPWGRGTRRPKSDNQ